MFYSESFKLEYFDWNFVWTLIGNSSQSEFSGTELGFTQLGVFRYSIRGAALPWGPAAFPVPGTIVHTYNILSETLHPLVSEKARDDEEPNHVFMYAFVSSKC